MGDREIKSDDRWLPNLAIEVPVWRIAADLNRATLMDGALLEPETTGPEALPTQVGWEVTGLVPLEEARRADPRRVEDAIESFLGKLNKSAAAFEEGGDYARFREAFSVPELEAEGGRFYLLDPAAPAASALRVWNWGATPRGIGARPDQVIGHSRIGALIASERAKIRAARIARGEPVEGGPGGSGGSGSPGSEGERAKRRRWLLLLVPLLALAAGLALWLSPGEDPDPEPDPPPVAEPDAGAPPPAEPDAGPPPPREPPAPPLPAPHQKIFFEVGEHALSATQRASLTAIRAYLEEQPRVRSLLIEGHADFRGAEEDNMGLSQRRAERVRAWLIERGVAAERLRTVGCSELYPLSTDPSARGRRENRRVEFFVLAPIPAEGPHEREGCLAPER